MSRVGGIFTFRLNHKICCFRNECVHRGVDKWGMDLCFNALGLKIIFHAGPRRAGGLPAGGVTGFEIGDFSQGFIAADDFFHPDEERFFRIVGGAADEAPAKIVLIMSDDEDGVVVEGDLSRGDGASEARLVPRPIGVIGVSAVEIRIGGIAIFSHIRKSPFVFLQHHHRDGGDQQQREGDVDRPAVFVLREQTRHELPKERPDIHTRDTAHQNGKQDNQ